MRTTCAVSVLAFIALFAAACGPGSEPGATGSVSSAITECGCTYTSTEWRNTAYHSGWSTTLSFYAKRDCYNNAFCGQVQAVSHLSVAPGGGYGNYYATQIPNVFYTQQWVPHNSNSYTMNYSEGSGWRTWPSGYSCVGVYSWWDSQTIGTGCVK